MNDVASVELIAFEVQVCKKLVLSAVDASVVELLRDEEFVLDLLLLEPPTCSAASGISVFVSTCRSSKTGSLVPSLPPFHLACRPSSDNSNFVLSFFTACCIKAGVTFRVCSCAIPVSKLRYIQDPSSLLFSWYICGVESPKWRMYSMLSEATCARWMSRSRGRVGR